MDTDFFLNTNNSNDTNNFPQIAQIYTEFFDNGLKRMTRIARIIFLQELPEIDHELIMNYNHVINY